MSAIDLSYSLLVMTYDRIYALRDPFGNRPLCIGKLMVTQNSLSENSWWLSIVLLKNISINFKYFIDDTENFCFAYIAASESCAFPPGSEYLCEVEPGEMIEISMHGVKSVWQVVFFNF